MSSCRQKVDVPHGAKPIRAVRRTKDRLPPTGEVGEFRFGDGGTFVSAVGVK